MFARLAAFAAVLLSACTSAPAPEPAAASDIQVMILGAFHMSNPGADLVNAQVDPVTTPEKQAQLEAVAEALAKFKPTAIAIERIPADTTTMLDARYPAFKPADLLTNPDERVQVGYRLANKMGLSRVYAIDEQDRPGQPSYFPFGPVQEWAKANGRGPELDALFGSVQAEAKKFEGLQRDHTISQLLRVMNDPEGVLGPRGHVLYMTLLSFGAGDDQPGANLNGRWYTRNAIIFSKLRQVAKPGDRIVVVYGSGHAYWLRQLVSEMPGYKLVEANDYLPE